MSGLLHRLYVRWRNRHDPAWKPTGIVQKFSGANEGLATAAAQRAVILERHRRRAAAKRAAPRSTTRRGAVVSMKERTGR